jgi:hypothetical protein
MSIILSLVSREPDIVLSEYTDCSGNFQVLARSLLKKVEKNKKVVADSKKYLKYFYILVINFIIIMIVILLI